MGVRQGLGTLIKQRDNKAQLKKQRHLIKEKKIQRQSPINKKKQRHRYKKIHKQKRGNVWVKQTRRRRRRGGGDDRIYVGYTENLAATKVVCSIWYHFRPESDVFTDIAGITRYILVFRVAKYSGQSTPEL